MILIYGLIAIVISLFIIDFLDNKAENKKLANMSPSEKEEYLEKKELRMKKFKENQKLETYGQLNEVMICPHCHQKGIRTKQVKQKKGISGAKATGAVLTGGLSLLAVGLSRKEGVTQAYCDNCTNTWIF